MNLDQKNMIELARLIALNTVGRNSADQFEIFGGAKEILSLDYAIKYLQQNFPDIQLDAVRPFAFVIGSNNNAEGIPNQFTAKDSLFFGNLKISINPNTSNMVTEKIRVKYRSFYNGNKPYWKHITRLIDGENIIYEASQTSELFSQIEIAQESSAYDLYVEFLGFKMQTRGLSV